MAEFGKLNFAVAFAPQTAFPLDARYYFTSLADAEAAAASSVEVGSSNGTYFYGENVVVVTETSATLYLIQPDKTLKEVGSVPVGDGKSIEIVDGQVAIKGFELAENGAQLTKGADGSLQWVKPDTTTVEGLSTQVESNRVAIETLTGNVYTKTETEAKIAGAGHASFKKVDNIPTVETAENNVLYLVMNADTGFYDIHAKVDNAVVRLDDVSVNLDAYSTTEEMKAAIDEAVKNKVDAVEGSRLITSDEATKLQSVETGAQVNFIKAVDTTNFSVDTDGKLTLTAVTESQVTGLTDALAKKASIEGLTTVESKVKALETNFGTLQTSVNKNTKSIEDLQAVAGTLDATYVKLTDYNTQIGAYTGLVHYASDTSTVIDEINNLNERLIWNELSE